METPHTLIFSDIHLTTAEPVDERYPLWKRYKHRDLFVDDDIAAMLAHARQTVDGPIEVVLNGDVFDFDACTDMPEAPDFPISWLERLRGLNPAEVKSTWKMERILDDHPVFVEALKDLLADGHRVVFTVGNHDLPLHWPGVQEVLIRRLQTDGVGDVRVCAWFYVSNEDTLIEHGHQYDAYCQCLDPISPTIRVLPSGEPRVRLPFGNYASRYMVNGMGLINPNADKMFIMPFWGFVVFFYRHVARTQPLLAWTWMWTAFATFVASMRDGLLPAEKDVLSLEDRVEEIAHKSQATPRMVRGLDALKAHPAIFKPWMVFRELWLDRLVLALLVFAGSFQFVATVKVFYGVSMWWFLVVLALLMVPYVFYAQSVSSDANNLDRFLEKQLLMIKRLTGLERLVLGHTHRERHTRIHGVEVLNSGTWSPVFEDVTCQVPIGRKCVVRLWPRKGRAREATLESWTEDGRFEVVPFDSHQPSTLLPLPDPTGVAIPSHTRADPVLQELGQRSKDA